MRIMRAGDHGQWWPITNKGGDNQEKGGGDIKSSHKGMYQQNKDKLCLLMSALNPVQSCLTMYMDALHVYVTLMT